MRRSWFESMRGSQRSHDRTRSVLKARTLERPRYCRCSSATEQRSHTAKVGCSSQPTGTNPAVVQRPERLNVAQEVDGSTPSPGTNSHILHHTQGRSLAWPKAPVSKSGRSEEHTSE